MRKITLLTGILLLFTGFISACNTNQVQTDVPPDEFYTSKTIEMLVPFGAGGGTDVFARFLSPFFNKYISGNPSLQVVNVEGGGSITGANEFVNAREHDGYNLLTTSASTHIPFLLGQSSVQYDLNKLKPVIGFPTGGVVYVSPNTGVEKPADIVNPDEPLVYAGISASGLDLITLLSYEVLGANVEAVLGYEGRGPSRVAFEQGESNIDYQTSSAFIESVSPLIERNMATPLYSFGQIDESGELIRDPQFPDLPTVKEVYVDIHGKDPSGPAWEAYKTLVSASFSIQKVVWLHSDAPEPAVEALNKAALSITEDPELMEKGEEIIGGYEPYTGEQLESIVGNMLSVPDDTLEWLRTFLLDKYDVDVTQL